MSVPAWGTEAVSFDATGTLLHSPDLYSIYAEVLTRHGADVAPEDVERLFGIVFKELDCLTPTGSDRFANHPEGARGWWAWFLERLCQLLEVAPPTRFAAAELFERFAHGDVWQVYPEVRAVLDELRSRGVRTVVLSNWDSRLRRLLKELDLDQYFQEVFVSAELGIAKPNPAVFLHVVHELQLSRPDRLLHIGDSAAIDGEGAQAAGVRFMLLERRTGGDLSQVLTLV